MQENRLAGAELQYSNKGDSQKAYHAAHNAALAETSG
jgi:hypothetical protein